MAEMAVMNDGSDDEAERKGGHIDIPQWVRGVNDYLGNFENVLGTVSKQDQHVRFDSPMVNMF